ncbi:MAG: TolC family protein [Bacillota bacterium]
MQKLFNALLYSLVFTVLSFASLRAQNRLSLKEAVEIALGKNPALASSKAGIDRSKGKYLSGISLPKPSLSLNYEYVPRNKSLGKFGERTIELSQEIEFPTVYFTRASQLKSQIGLSQAEYEKTRITVASQVKKAYCNQLAKIKHAEIAKLNLGFAESFLEKAKTRSDLGEASNLELLTARVQAKQALNELQSAEYEVKIAENELISILGYPSEALNNHLLLSDSLGFKEIDLNINELINQALNSNPDYKMAEANLDFSRAGSTLAYSGLLPGFNIAYARQSEQGNSDLYGMTFGISLPLWFIFEQNGQIQEAKADLRSSEAELEGVKNSIRLNVNNSYNRLKNDERQLKLYRDEILIQSEEIFKAARISYDEGEISYLEFMQASQTLLNSRTGYIDMLLNYNNSLTALEEALGREIEN